MPGQTTTPKLHHVKPKNRQSGGKPNLHLEIPVPASVQNAREKTVLMTPKSSTIETISIAKLDQFSIETMSAPTHRSTFSLFQEFAATSQAKENLDFISAIDQIETQLSTDAEAQKVSIEKIETSLSYQEKFANIYNQFIREGAASQINISHTTFNILFQTAGHDSKLPKRKSDLCSADRTLFRFKYFDLARKELRELLQTNHLVENFKKKCEEEIQSEMHNEEAHTQRTSQNPSKNAILYMHENNRHHSNTAPTTPNSQTKLSPQYKKKANKETIMVLVNKLNNYLRTINRNNDDDNCCSACSCFNIAKKRNNKDAIHKNINELMEILSQALSNWCEDHVNRYIVEVSNSLEKHKKLIGNNESEFSIITDLQSALDNLSISLPKPTHFVFVGSRPSKSSLAS